MQLVVTPSYLPSVKEDLGAMLSQIRPYGQLPAQYRKHIVTKSQALPLQPLTRLPLKFSNLIRRCIEEDPCGRP